MFGSVARSRLLPMSLPFRYFGAAVAFHALAWGVLLFAWKDFPDFGAGLGPVFGALHAITLGVLVMAAVGATLQLLPVATRQPVRALWAVKLVWWLLAPGVLVFVTGAARYQPHVMGLGALAVVLALSLYCVLLAKNLSGARGMKVVVAHGWAALACLVALAGTGLALVGRYEHGWALDLALVRNAHLILASYGFMGLLALGLSTFLLPMLAVAPPPPAPVMSLVLGAALLAILVGSLGFALPAAMVGLAAAVTHILAMERSLRARLRPPLGPWFILIRVSWACLLASLALAASMALDLSPPRAALLFGLLLVPGWLLTFLLGVLQRIVPFLASVHASSSARGTPVISALTPGGVLAAHRWLHLIALGSLLAAALVAQPWLALLGAAAGFAGAAAFAAFFAFVLMKVHHGIQPPHQPAPARGA